MYSANGMIAIKQINNSFGAGATSVHVVAISVSRDKKKIFGIIWPAGSIAGAENAKMEYPAGLELEMIVLWHMIYACICHPRPQTLIFRCSHVSVAPSRGVLALSFSGALALVFLEIL
mmetsp:Transcript_26297/g.63369  ORF Transcript_26297/g.63369 Transcript_26297/m.63369 type:complete len:118 (-) Transcript_26297:136-489(-)